MYASVDQGLDALRDHERFEVLVSALLIEAHPDLVPVGGVADSGRDAIVREGLFGGERVRFQYSLQKNWRRKVRTELDRYSAEGGPRSLVFFFSGPVGRGAAEKVERAAADIGFKITIHGRQWLIPRLEAKWELAERFLSVAPRVPSRLVSAAEYASRLTDRIPGFSAVLAGATTARDTVAEFLKGSARALVIVGAGGTGKTRIALESIAASSCAFVLPLASPGGREVAAEIAAGTRAILLVDDAHSRTDLRELQATIRDYRWKDLKMILTVRPGYADRVTHDLALLPAECEKLPLQEMRRAEIDRLLRNEPHRLTDGSLRLRLVKLAQGNPLIAHMAATAVRESGLDVDSRTALLRHFAKADRFSERERLAAGLVALLGAFVPVRDIPLVTRLLAGESVPTVLATLNRLADEGVLHESEQAYAVKPDVLAPVLIADAFFPEGRPPPVELSGLLAGIDPARARPLIERLASATSIASRRGADLLRDAVQSSWPSEGDFSVASWTEALDLVQAYGYALPREASTLLSRACEVARAMSATWTHEDATAVAMRAAKATEALAAVDLDIAVHALLDIVVSGRDLGYEVEKSPALKQLRELSERASTFQYASVGARQADIAEAVHRWNASATQIGWMDVRRVWAATAVSAGEVLRFHFESVEESPESGSRIVLGQFEAPFFNDIRVAVGNATSLVCQAVPNLSPQAQHAVLARVENIEGIARNGMVAYGGTASSGARGELKRAVDRIVRAYVQTWDALPISVRQRLMWVKKGRPELARRARSDHDLGEFIAIYPAREHGLNWERSERLNRARAARVAARFLPLEAARKLEHALTAGEGLSNPSGAYAFVDELARRVDASEALELVKAFVEAPRLRPYASHVLYSALMRHGAARSDLVSAVLDLPGGDTVVVQALDALDPVTEHQTVSLLIKRANAPLLELADHIHRCARLGLRKKFSLLSVICDRVPRDQLARIFTIIAWVLKTGGADPTPAQARRMMRHLLVLVSMEEPERRSGSVYLDPLLKLATSGSGECVSELVVARLKVLLRDRGYNEDERRVLLDRTSTAVRSLSFSEWKERQTAALAWLKATFENPFRSDEAAYELLRALLPRERYLDLLLGWASDAATRFLALEALRGRCPSPEFYPVAAALLRAGLSRDEESDLLSAGLHGGFAGPISLHYRERERYFLPWESDPDPAVRRFGARARRAFEAGAVSEEKREQREEDE